MHSGKIDSKKKIVSEGCIQIPSENDADPRSQPPEQKIIALRKREKFFSKTVDQRSEWR